jgi:hypothetical protein
VQQLKYLEFRELAAITHLVWRRKRVIANNLQVRRAIDSFSNSALEFADICRVLQESLDSAGFCGISIGFPQIDWMN